MFMPCVTATSRHSKEEGQKEMTMRPAWYEKANCIGVGGEVFFPEPQIGVNHRDFFDEAQGFCNKCTVRSACLEYAMQCETSDIRRFGMFGGLTPRQREALAKKRSGK
jgi:hypothetical protein